ncbi:hypothetical protein F444_22685 [Phytophthora nicotianae P1976]|uniref:Uncharacterized protein n=1 Tax=Phytophthora nicotianae P1976 TaxID=1317066 RepID=A0A080YX26_PHYNI|nr:hypothetical protein F444_22685 [Phytophthora nicotianae P1976]
MTMIDITRCNTYICHTLAQGDDVNGATQLDGSSSQLRGRDRHRSFVAELIGELFDGTWRKWKKIMAAELYMQTRIQRRWLVHSLSMNTVWDQQKIAWVPFVLPKNPGYP